MVNWDSLCRPSAEGGLGFKLLRQMNMALLCTWYNGRIHDGREFCGLSTGVQWRRVGKENIYLISGEVYSMTGSFWKWILESSCYAVLVMRSPAANRRTEQVYCKNSISNGNWDCSWDSERWLVWRIWRMKGPRRLNMHLWQVRGDKLQVATLLYSQQAFPSPMCSTCDKAVEFTLHSMRAREWSSQVL